MISFLAASAILSSARADQVTTRVPSPIETITASLMQVGVPSNPPMLSTAILIDKNGWFMVSTGSNTYGELIATSADRGTVHFRLIGRDDVSQLSLYQALEWPVNNMHPVELAKPRDLNQQKIIAVLPSQTLIGEVVSQSRVGIVQPSQRYVPLSEIRFEQPGIPYGGSPIFTFDGKLAGILNAALVPYTMANEVDPNTGNQIQKIRIGEGPQRTGSQDFGPRGLSIGFSLAPTVISRVVEGFRSTSHKVLHPAIGMLYRNVEQSSTVEVQSVDPGSPAEKAGLQAGDRIIKLDNIVITNAIQLASELFDSQVGQNRLFTIQRQRTVLQLTVKVGVLPQSSGNSNPTVDNL